MPKTKTKIDADRAYAMVEAGCPAPVIAERLGCSVRHARRFCEVRDEPPNALIGTDREVHVWKLHYWTTGSYREVAHRFGVTRQAVQQALSSFTQAR